MAVMQYFKKVTKRTHGLLLAAAVLGIAGCGQDVESYRHVALGTLGNNGSSPSDVLDYQKRAERSISQPLIPFAGAYSRIKGTDPVHLIVASYGRILASTGLPYNRLSGQTWDRPEDLIPHQLAAQGFSWRPLDASLQSNGTESSRLQLEYQGLPVNSSYALVQSEESGGGNALWMRGSVPEWFFKAPGQEGIEASGTVGIFHYSAEDVRTRYAAEQGYSSSMVTLDPDGPLYFLSENKLHAAYRLKVASDPSGTVPSPAFPLEAIIDAETAEILEQTPLAFHLDGWAQAFRENSVASKSEGMVDVSLPALEGAGDRLSSPLFQVENCGLQAVSEACGFRATGPEGDYRSITMTSENYDEVVAYYAISRAMAWYRTLMGTSSGSFQQENTWGSQRQSFGLASERLGKLNVFVRAQTRTPTSGQTLDNAVYLPSGTTGGTSPEIVIGTGWEATMTGTPPRSLRYIGKDGDVSMHEFGHHIVFRTINQIKGQALGMHEGFADYFTYAITGNNLLAESVVSGGTSLRAGNRQGTLTDYPPTSATPPHAAGEFWSTVLWDIRSSLGAWQGGFSKFDKIAYHAIDLMQPNETYYGAIVALSRSAEIFASVTGDDAIALKEKIFAQFYRRGFIERPNGSGVVPAPSPLLMTSTPSTGLASESKSPAAPTSTSSSPKKSSFLGMSCTIGGAGHLGNLAGGGASSPAVDLGTLVLLLAMLGLPIVRLLQSGREPKRLAIRVVKDTLSSRQDHSIHPK